MGTQIWTAAFSVNSSTTLQFLLSFLTGCHRTGPEQTMKCAEHILPHTLLQWLLNLEEVIWTATAVISVCQGAPNWIHNRKGRMNQFWLLNNTWPGDQRRQGCEWCYSLSMRHSSVPAGTLFNAILYPYSPTSSALKGHERQSLPPQVTWQGLPSSQWPWVAVWPSLKVTFI